jgi:hypothetical protein
MYIYSVLSVAFPELYFGYKNKHSYTKLIFNTQI